MTVEFGEQIARARQGSGRSEQAFAHFVGDPDAAQEELSELGKAIGAADEAAGQARPAPWTRSSARKPSSRAWPSGSGR